MCIYREFWINWERKNLAPYATHSDHPWYTERNDSEVKDDIFDRYGNLSRYRTPFEIDKDRITNCQSFRRLEYKTQVFVTHEGDNYRTRLTHSLEVSEISRHIARALRLNEHLVESIALGHDLGHAPYGHIAERTINRWINKEIGPHIPHISEDYFFCHNRHSVENVERLEPGYDWDARDEREGFGQGLNLTRGVREGILVHTCMGFRGRIHENATFNDEYETAIRKLSDSSRSKGLFFPGSLEAQVVRVADDLAQRIHDLEDGLRSQILKKEHISEKIVKFFEELRIFRDKQITNPEHYIKHNNNIKVSKAFLDDIVTLFEQDGKNQTNLEIKKYNNIESSTINQINKKLQTDIDYKDKMVLTAKIAFLLHMWRDDEYLAKLDIEEQNKAIRRILKYLKIVLSIKESHLGKKSNPPAFHYIALLRGLMLANVIEHSYWKIHYSLDPDFRNYENKESCRIENQQKNKFHVIIIVVDGLITGGENRTTNENIKFEKSTENNRIHRFRFNNKDAMQLFLKTKFKEILINNGSSLCLDKFRKLPYHDVIKKLNWLNKSENPEETEKVRIIENNDNEICVPIENVRIYFTGYQELCPGPSLESNQCKYSTDILKESCSRSLNKCKFFSLKIKYPDINRIINFDHYMSELDILLKNLITDRMHNSSRIKRMNYMGEKIIIFLLNEYFKNPRIMHDRVWSRLRCDYPNWNSMSRDVKEWVEKSIIEREGLTIPEKVLECLVAKQKKNNAWECDRYALLRRIIEHIAGMTDRFISNEYNRLNQGGRESEIQDETYFFS